MFNVRAGFDLAMAMVIVGSSVVAGKLMIVDLPVFFASMVRFALACLVIVPLLYAREGGFPRLSRASWRVFALQALCGGFLFNVFLLYGLKWTDAGAAGVITSATPASMGLIAWLCLGERPTRGVVLGIALAVAGVLAINLQAGGFATAGGSAGGWKRLAGNLLVVLAVVAESLFLLLRKRVPETLSPLAVSTLMSLFGLAWFLPAGLWEARGVDVAVVPVGAWLTVGYYGLCITVAAYLFWFRGIVRVSAGVAGVFTGVMPVSALALSALVLGQPVTWVHVAGCACVLAGIVCISGVWRKG